jgi:hypothetical protein
MLWIELSKRVRNRLLAQMMTLQYYYVAKDLTVQSSARSELSGIASCNMGSNFRFHLHNTPEKRRSSDYLVSDLQNTRRDSDAFRGAPEHLVKMLTLLGLLFALCSRLGLAYAPSNSDGGKRVYEVVN